MSTISRNISKWFARYITLLLNNTISWYSTKWLLKTYRDEWVIQNLFDEMGIVSSGVPFTPLSSPHQPMFVFTYALVAILLISGLLKTNWKWCGDNNTRATGWKKLPQKHAGLWDIFKGVGNKRDAEAYQQLLRDEAIRVVFYDKLAAYARLLKLALSSIQFINDTKESTVDRYKEDLSFFIRLRLAVVQRYSDTINYKQYEGQIQKLIDTHIQTHEVSTITELVNIFDKEKFQQEVMKTLGDAAKADKIASRTAEHISEKMDEDPAFYKKFSDMLKETIKAYEEHRLNELQYLNKVKEIMESVLSQTDTDIPESLKDKDVTKAFYGIVREALTDKIEYKKQAQIIAAESSAWSR